METPISLYVGIVKQNIVSSYVSKRCLLGYGLMSHTCIHDWLCAVFVCKIVVPILSIPELKFVEGIGLKQNLGFEIFLTSAAGVRVWKHEMIVVDISLCDIYSLLQANAYFISVKVWMQCYSEVWNIRLNTCRNDCLLLVYQVS